MCSSGPLVAELKLLITAQSSRNIFRSPGYATLVSRVRIPMYRYLHIYSKKAWEGEWTFDFPRAID